MKLPSQPTVDHEHGTPDAGATASGFLYTHEHNTQEMNISLDCFRLPIPIRFRPFRVMTYNYTL